MAGQHAVLITIIFMTIMLNRSSVSAQGPFGIIKSLLQSNIAGDPVIHKRFDFDFDPDAAVKRRSLYYETNGFRGERFIERIGVGIDGREDERRVLQEYRDQGRLNGEHFINFP